MWILLIILLLGIGSWGDGYNCLIGDKTNKYLLCFHLGDIQDNYDGDDSDLPKLKRDPMRKFVLLLFLLAGDLSSDSILS